MELPPGPCSSPPGPRPVPPPRKGSMERRPLSPSRRGSEHSGAWDAASDVSARGSKPGTPERALVTQRVLIVMQSHASPAAVTMHGPSPTEDTPITSCGASPPPRTSEGGQEMSPPESTPITSVATSILEHTLTPSLPIQNRVTSPPSPPIQNPAIAPPPSPPIQNRATSPPSPPIQNRATSPPSPPIQNPAIAPPPSPPIQNRATSPPSPPIQNRATSPPSAPIQNPAIAPPPSPPIQNRATSPPSPPIQNPATSPPSAPIQNRVTSPPSPLIQNQATSPPSTPIQNRVTSPPSPLIQNQATSPPSPPIQNQVTSPPSPPIQNRVTSPPSPPIQKWATSTPPSPPIQNQATSPPSLPIQNPAISPPTTPIQKWATSPLTTPVKNRTTSSPPQSPPVQKWTTSPLTTPIQNWGAPQTPRTSKGDQEPSLLERTPISVVTSLPERTPTLSTPILNQGTSPSSTAPVQDQEAPPTQNIQRTCGVATDQENAEIQSTLKETRRVSELESMATTHGGPLSNVILQDLGVPPGMSAPNQQMVSPLDDIRGMSSQTDIVGRAPGAPPNYTGAQDCTANHDRLSSQPAVGTRMPQDGGIREDIITRNLCEIAVTPPSGASQSVTSPQSVTVSTARPEEAKSAAVLEEAKSAVAAQSITPILPNVITQQEVQQKQDGGPVFGGTAQTQANSTSQSQTSSLPTQPSLGWSSLSPIRVADPTSPHRSMFSKPPLPIPPRSNLYPSHPLREQETSATHETASLSSLKCKAPAPDTLSYLDSVSLMSGTMESLTILDDASSIGSDSEINGMPYRKTDKYGFLGGNQYSGNGETAIPVEIARQRELKWLDMFSNWDKWLMRRFQKVKLRCRKGIPSSLRAKAWQFLSNSHELLTKNPGKFEEMERQQGDPKWLDVIEKDLHRQFPFHEMFAARGGHGQQDLYRILKAYTVYRPEEGYCQAQAPVAAVLLMHMPAEQAFWCLVQICDKYLPGYYSAGLEAIQLDGEIFFALLRRICPMAYRHLKKFKIDPILYMTEWFMCIFSRTLPWAAVLRVWDMFFCEGVKIVFRVGLVLLKHTLGSVDKLRSCQGMYETMEKLRSLPVHCMQEDVLLPEVSSLPVTDALIERESNTQLRKWRENRGELQYRPSRRLHGARQIYEEKVRLNPTLSGSRLSLSSIRRPSPPATPALAVQPESVVVSEGLRPALPSPTSNKTPLGPPREATKKGKEKQREQEKKREKEERERERKREREEREERRKEKEREKQREKEEKRLQKEREKVDARQKKERKFSFRRKESSAPDSPRNNSPGATESSATHDTYF